MTRRLGLPLLLLSGCMAAAEPPPPAEPKPPPVIQIVAGTYGSNCRAPQGNKTEHLQQSCGGRPTCSYKIDYTVIGDPVVSCGKDYVAEWRCGDDPTIHKATAAPEAGYGAVVELRCDSK